MMSSNTLTIQNSTFSLINSFGNGSFIYSEKIIGSISLSTMKLDCEESSLMYEDEYLLSI